MMNNSNNRIKRCGWSVSVCVSLVLFIATVSPASANAEENKSRPRIGLVLGGGGARGAAHIGVLKELERLRVPVDAIAGTSMGAIVGGLYATGMNAAELEQLVKSIDWSATLADAPNRSALSFRRKQDDREFPIKLELGLRGSDLVLPIGVIQGQKLDLLLRKLTLSVSHISNFDELPIPFRAIASDIVTGDEVVLRSGDLARAIRASMSVPGVFAPTRIGDRLLVDGGITGNLPIDIIKKMDVDIIIAVDVEFPLYTKEELGSVLTISEQVLTILIHQETVRQIESLSSTDLLIRPDLGTYAASNFGDITDVIAPGEAATHALADSLQSLSLQQPEWQMHLASRKPTVDEVRPLSFVRVIADNDIAPEVLSSRLSVAAGDEIDAAILAENANRLYGLQLYEHVGYTLIQEGNDVGVEFRATSKSWGPNFLQFGISLEDDFEGSSGFNLATRLTRAGLNSLGAEWRTDLQLGTDPTLSSEFYQPLSFDSRWFVAPRIQIGQSNLNAFAMDATVARYRLSEGSLSLDVGRELGTIGELRVGAFRGGGDATLKVGDPMLPNFDFDTGGMFARLRVDSVDNAQFPRRGTLADIAWTLSRPGFGGELNFDTVEADVSHAWSRGKSSVQLGLSYATTLSGDNVVQEFFPLGGFLRLSGLERGEISGPHAALLKLVYYRRVGSSTGGIFETPIYLGVSAEAGNVWQTRAAMSFGSLQFNSSVFAGIDTYLGPIYIAAGFAEEGHTNFYLFIGSPPK